MAPQKKEKGVPRGKMSILVEDLLTQDDKSLDSENVLRTRCRSCTSLSQTVVRFLRCWDVVLVALLLAGVVIYCELQLSFYISLTADVSWNDSSQKNSRDSISYNLFESAKHLYTHGAKVLSVLLIVWSGILPCKYHDVFTLLQQLTGQ